MSVRIMPLRLEAFEQLPKHARRCVFWELDPATLSAGDYLPDPEFEKEAWLSMVMLEWGSCGQVATKAPAEGSESDDEEPCLGYVLYAPPRAVPRAARFPSGPVSADAVLLTSMGIEPGQTDGLTHSLISQVVTELVRRGVRALEAFGRTADADELLVDAADPELRTAIEALGDCSFDQCMIGADFLLDAGFTVVAPHRYFPRLRLELDKGLGWKAEVEAALERLLTSAQLQQPVGAGAEIRG
ncbi:hypothetical protein FHT40_000687 [Mycolicibacterium sp. BK556]|uniref:acetyltransferase n=1 Tax=Mycobacteriaceae TaxID=1762 RepID=UPI0016201160|nr:acetyltransferase [Mycobacterium sp. BK086]MBB3601054.1 hypothetical protein [Mycolicibacterium sp. BK556]MBB3630808.1 hypothetical protein [Mycolicibacterium sp. BK607]MBB3748804.1 hypothetical protein [Mycolicibacterium sp. BK634]